jgi:1-acyl-sn-glycerol-3-phosphate acyltransferase
VRMNFASFSVHWRVSRLVRFCRSVGRAVKLAAMFVYATLELIVQRPATRQQRAEWLHRFCTRALCGMGVAVRQQGTFPERGVVIANHLGYLDVVALAATHRCVFVGKSEIRRWPFLGWMTNMAGTIYVERGRGGSAQRAKSGTQAAADAGLPLVFFPEGTTSLGKTVLKFHTGLLTQAIQADQPITAAHIRYRLTEDNSPALSLSDVCFWDNTPLMVHLFRLLAVRGIEIDLHFAASPIVFTEEAHIHRKIAAEEAHSAVMELRNAETASVNP